MVKTRKFVFLQRGGSTGIPLRLPSWTVLQPPTLLRHHFARRNTRKYALTHQDHFPLSLFYMISFRVFSLDFVLLFLFLSSLFLLWYFLNFHKTFHLHPCSHLLQNEIVESFVPFCMVYLRIL